MYKNTVIAATIKLMVVVIAALSVIAPDHPATAGQAATAGHVSGTGHHVACDSPWDGPLRPYL